MVLEQTSSNSFYPEVVDQIQYELVERQALFFFRITQVVSDHLAQVTLVSHVRTWYDYIAECHHTSVIDMARGAQIQGLSFLGVMDICGIDRKTNRALFQHPLVVSLACSGVTTLLSVLVRSHKNSIETIRLD